MDAVRLHAQEIPLYSQTEAGGGSWTGAISSANEANPHTGRGGDCNYLPVFPPESFRWVLRDTRRACLTASDNGAVSTPGSLH